MRPGRNLLFALIPLVLGAAAAAQATIYVDASNTPPGSGTQADPFVTINAAIAAVSQPFTNIEVAPGVYVENFELASSWVGAIRSSGGPLQTTLMPAGPGPIIKVRSWVGIEGFTITGVPDPADPAIEITDGNRADLVRCIVYANAGTGIRTEYDLSTDFCTITANGGAGIVCAGPCFMFIDNTIDKGNFFKSSYGSVNVNLDYSIVDPLPGSYPTAIFKKAQLWNVRDDDLYLKPGSPAIDAANPLAPPDPDGSPADIGAIPYDPNHAPVQPRPYCTSRVNSLGCSAQVDTSGAPSASGSSFTIDCSNVLNQKSGLFFYGYTPKAVPYQGGWLCVLAPARRTALQNAGGTPPPAEDCSGVFLFDFGALIQSGKDPALVAGQSVFGQFWYRDSKQTGAWQTGRSEGIGFVIGP